MYLVTECPSTVGKVIATSKSLRVKMKRKYRENELLTREIVEVESTLNIFQTKRMSLFNLIHVFNCVRLCFK